MPQWQLTITLTCTPGDRGAFHESSRRNLAKIEVSYPGIPTVWTDLTYPVYHNENLRAAITTLKRSLSREISAAHQR
ncbi:hypothetical protein HJC99_02160 [Candidatus Saccharibacteria bacterium]|nr:hypothetical protein [Candidatus Saccharibacteria bacterium]